MEVVKNYIWNWMIYPGAQIIPQQFKQARFAENRWLSVIMIAFLKDDLFS